MKRVWIFGDSFADPNWEKERYVHETWYEKLEKQYDEYHNFAFAGTGPHYSFKEFYQRYESFNAVKKLFLCLNSFIYKVARITTAIPNLK